MILVFVSLINGPQENLQMWQSAKSKQVFVFLMGQSQTVMTPRCIFQFSYNWKTAASDKKIWACWRRMKASWRRGRKKNSSPPCGPQSIHCSRLISFGCIILSVSIANLTVPKAWAPDWSIQNQTTNYWAHHALLNALLLLSLFFSPSLFSLSLSLSSSCGVHVHKSSSQAVLGFHFPDLP